MKKIINGKMYNTETAKELHSWDNMRNCSSITDFNYYEESLYETRNGSYFLYGKGGPSSPYSRPVSGGRGYGEDIQPIPEGEAMKWLEQHEGEEVLLTLYPATVKEA